MLSKVQANFIKYHISPKEKWYYYLLEQMPQRRSGNNNLKGPKYAFIWPLRQEGTQELFLSLFLKLQFFPVC